MGKAWKGKVVKSILGPATLRRHRGIWKYFYTDASSHYLYKKRLTDESIVFSNDFDSTFSSAKGAEVDIGKGTSA